MTNLRSLFHFLYHFAIHLKGSLNVVADKRGVLVFSQIIPQVDIFATRGNKKVRQFFTLARDPGTIAVNALAHPGDFL